MVEKYVNSVIGSLNNMRSHLHFFENGKSVERSGEDIKADVDKMVDFFARQGFAPGDRIGIHGENSYLWIVVDLACLACGLSTVGMDPKSGHNIDKLEIECSIKRTFYLDSDEALRAVLVSQEEPKSKVDGYSVDNPYEYTEKEAIGLRLTSGSTGDAKAIELRRESVDDTLLQVQALFQHNSSDRLLLFLPLYLYQQRFWVYSSIIFGHDAIIVPYRFAIAAMQRKNPTVIMGVPDFFESLVANLDIGDEPACEQFIQRLGGNIRYLWTGSAAISSAALEKYRALNLPLFQGYGMNETCIVSKNYPQANRWGSVGRVLPGKDVSFDHQNQILVSCDFPVNNRYLNVPHVESEEVFLLNGKVATGDVGYLDDDGYLYITGRIKDLIALSSGRKVAPIPIEKKLESHNCIEKAVVFGDGRKFLCAVLVPNASSVNKEALDAAVEKVNDSATADERVVSYIVSDEPITIENGLLTSQFKVRRQAVWDRYCKPLTALYDS